MHSVKEKIGSYTAKGGFDNEHDIVAKFNNWKSDRLVQVWLLILGYDFHKMQYLQATQIPSNIGKEKANESSGFNQVDKRKVDTYQTMWNFSPEIANLLKLFTGKIKPSDLQQETIKDSRRINFQEMTDENRGSIIAFFTKNKHQIINDIFQGRGALKADWMLVTCKNKDGTLTWVLKDIITVCNFYSQGEVNISPRGSLKIGKVTMQRKGGTPDPTSLQFKCNPLKLFKA